MSNYTFNDASSAYTTSSIKQKKRGGFNSFKNKFSNRKGSNRTPELQDIRKFDPMTPDGGFETPSGPVTPYTPTTIFSSAPFTPKSLFSTKSHTNDNRSYLTTPSSASKPNRTNFLEAKRKPSSGNAMSHSTSMPVIFSPRSYASNSRHSNVPDTSKQDDVCVFCDLSFSIKFTSEQNKELSCGHCAHLACLKQLLSISIEFSDNSIACPVCDEETDIVTTQELVEGPKWSRPATVHEASGSLFEAPISKPQRPRPLIINDIDSGSSRASSFLDSPTSNNSFSGYNPASNNVRRAETANSIVDYPLSAATTHTDNSGSGDSLFCYPEDNFSRLSVVSHNDYHNDTNSPTSITAETSIFRKDMVRMFENSDDVVFCGNCTRPVKLISYAIPSDEDEDKVKVGVGIYAPKTPHENGGKEYSLTSKDIAKTLELKSQISEHKHHGVRIGDFPLGALRFRSLLNVSSDDNSKINWNGVLCFLFENYIIIQKGPKIKVVIDIKTGLSSIKFNEDGDYQLKLTFSDKSLPKINLNCSNVGTILMWNYALSKPHMQFPIDPSDEYLEEIKERFLDKSKETPQVSRAPSEVILCFPLGRKTDNILIEQTIREVINSMEHFDKIGVILYNAYGVAKVIGITPAEKFHWNKIVNDLRISNLGNEPATGQKPIYSLEIVLNKAASMLENHNIMESSASIVLVTDNDFKMSSSFDIFQDTETPLHVIGIGKTTNPTKLNAVCKATRGSFTYAADYKSMQRYVKNLVKLECRYILKNMKLKFKTRIGTKITSCSYTSGNKIDESDGSVTWDIGKLRAGDSAFLTFELKGNCNLGIPLVRANMTANNILSSLEDYETNSYQFRIAREDQEESTIAKQLSLFSTENCLFQACQAMDQIIFPLLNKQIRPAYNTLDRTVEMLKSSIEHNKITSQTERRVVACMITYFDSICEALISKDVEGSEVIPELLHDYWLLRTRRSLAAFSELEKFLHYEML